MTGARRGSTAAEDVALAVDGTVVARYVTGPSVEPELGPRPHLHPVRTLAGRIVTDSMPDDHRWHLGVSVAVQDVGKVNLWGGRTYVRDRGYTHLDDHGIIRHLRWHDRRDDGFSEDLGWYAPDGRQLLEEFRTVMASRVPGAEHVWVLGFRFVLRNVTGAPLALGSPATNGREGAGYGGFFWRLPPTGQSVRVFTEHAEGETAVHGSVAPWLAFSDDGPAGDAPYTVVFSGADGATRGDPWFVRVEDYPGVCSALAFTTPLQLRSNGTASRDFRVLVADGVLEAPSIAPLIRRA